MVGGEPVFGRRLWRGFTLRGERRKAFDRADEKSLARLGGDVVGVDASESNIVIANLHASRDPFLPYSPPPSLEPQFERPTSSSSDASATPTPSGSARKPTVGSLEYRHTPAEALRDAGEKFDVVCAMEVLEHVDEPGEFMRCLGEMVKVGWIWRDQARSDERFCFYSADIEPAYLRYTSMPPLLIPATPLSPLLVTSFGTPCIPW